MGVLQRGAFPQITNPAINVPQITNPAIKRIPHITHLIANLLFIFFLECYPCSFFVFCLYRDGIFEHGASWRHFGVFGSGCLGSAVRPIFMFFLNRDGAFEHGPGSGRTMTWQENGRFYYAALLASDTPGHPGTSDTYDTCSAL